ncbi:MAG: hypothetical protein ACFB22_08035 [Rhodothalassiaceae bacterium]
MSDPLRDRLIDAAFTELATAGWRRSTIAAVCSRADARERDFRREFATMTGVVLAGLRRFNDAVYAAAQDLEPEDTARERLFELILARFEAARPHKAAVAELRRAALSDPVLGAALAQSLDQTMELILHQAGIETDGIIGRARRTVLAGLVYAPVLDTWLKDDSETMGPTMSELDKRLERAEQLARLTRPSQIGRARIDRGHAAARPSDGAAAGTTPEPGTGEPQ